MKLEMEDEHFWASIKGLGYEKVVRCKDCKWCRTKKSTTVTKHCQWWRRSVRDNDFCNKGEKDA